MRKTKKLAICLCVSTLMMILSAAALMTELALPAEALTSNDVVYYGNYPQGGTSPDFTVDPILWRVLEVSGDRALMLSEKILDGGVPFNPDHGQSWSSWWSESPIRKFLNGKEEYVPSPDPKWEVTNPKGYSFYEKAFSAGEGSGIISADVDNSSVYEGSTVTPGPNTTDKIFLLSYADVDSSDPSSKPLAKGRKYGFVNSDSRKAELTDYGASQGVSSETIDNKKYDYWWLRSPGDGVGYASRVDNDGDLHDRNVSDGAVGLRPAFRLNLKSLLFTSPAKDGKQSGVVTELQKQVYDDNGYIHTPTGKNFTEHKLTLAAERYKLDDAKLLSGDLTPGRDVVVTYSGASTGTGYHLAVVVTSGDKALYYGQIKSLGTPEDASGTAEFTVPELNDGEEVYVFVEGRNNNDDKMTDFASLPKCISNNGRTITYALPDVEESPVELKSIAIRPSTLTITAEFSYQLTVSITPYDAAEEIEWHSDDESIATVDTNGLVTAQKVGTTTIRAKAKTCDEPTSCIVTVTENTQGPGIILTPVSMTISKGITERITAAFNGGIAEQPILWKSSNEKVATVDENGTVTAISEGECMITAKTADGPYEAECKVKVVAATQIHSGGGSSGCNAGIPGIVTLLTLGSLIYIRSRNGK